MMGNKNLKIRNWRIFFYKSAGSNPCHFHVRRRTLYQPKTRKEGGGIIIELKQNYSAYKEFLSDAWHTYFPKYYSQSFFPVSFKHFGRNYLRPRRFVNFAPVRIQNSFPQFFFPNFSILLSQVFLNTVPS